MLQENQEKLSKGPEEVRPIFLPNLPHDQDAEALDKARELLTSEMKKKNSKFSTHKSTHGPNLCSETQGDR